MIYLTTPEWRFFPLEQKNAFENMAIDECLFRNKIAHPELPNSIRLYQWSPSAVSIGKHQDLQLEVDLKAAKNLGIDVVRRITGGGAVLHDQFGEITYSIVASSNDYEQYSDEQLVISLLHGLEIGFTNLGLSTTYDKIHCPSLFVKGKKISGNAQARHKDVILQHGTILLDYNPGIMYTVLKARPNKPRSRMIESVYAYVTTLKNELGTIVDTQNVAKQIEEGFKQGFNISSWYDGTSKLSSEEEKIKNFYLTNRFSNDQWLYEKVETEFNYNY